MSWIRDRERSVDLLPESVEFELEFVPGQANVRELHQESRRFDFTLTEGPPKLSLEDFFGLGAESGPLYEGISHPLQNLAPFPR